MKGGYGFIPAQLNHGSQHIRGGGGDTVPPISAYEKFCQQFVAGKPRLHKDSPWRDPKKIRRIALGSRGENTAPIAAMYGRSQTWVANILRELPPELR